jgi:hypothetical protein
MSKYCSAHALLVLQFPATPPNQDPELLATFEQALDAQSDLLRRVDDPVMRSSDTRDVCELRCTVEYGPVRASSLVRLHQALDRALAEISFRALGHVVDRAVLNTCSARISPQPMSALTAGTDPGRRPERDRPG